MICATNLMEQLCFINQPLAQHVSGTIMPIFRSARPYITAYGFQHLMCTVCTRPASRLPKTPASTLSILMQAEALLQPA